MITVIVILYIKFTGYIIVMVIENFGNRSNGNVMGLYKVMLMNYYKTQHTSN